MSRVLSTTHGIGFVADIKGRKSHEIVQQAIQVLLNLNHRGACGCEANTGGGSIPEARTKKDAEQAESKIKQDVFEGRYGKKDTGTMKLSSFIDEIYMPWAKSNKTSWLNDHYNAVTLKNYFGEKKLKEIQPLDVERFSQQGIRDAVAGL